MVRLLLTCSVIFFLFQTAIARNTASCPTLVCGRINISYPFRLQSDPISCGDHQYKLSCENNFTVLHLDNGGKYYVQAINYDNFTIRLVDSGVDNKDDCSSIPSFPLTSYSFRHNAPYTLYKRKQHFRYSLDLWEKLPADMIGFIKCPYPVNSSLYLDTSPCIHGLNSSTNSSLYSYAYVGEVTGYDLRDGCSLEMVSLLSRRVSKNRRSSYIEIYRDFAFGFELSWFNINCRKCSSRSCYLDRKDHIQCTYVTYHWDVYNILNLILGLLQLIIYFCPFLLIARFLCGTPFVSAFIIYKWRRRHLSGYNAIEEFLQTQNNLMPIRYAYSDIKKMSGGFKEMLGKGGFGSVYKGKLRSGQFAAIKMLEKSKAKGQDFMSEVATIGRIHHANVVQLIGFCSEGSKHALIYEFMSNGSLDSHIFSPDRSISLSWEKLYEISLGVARGIEYLHRGCDIQILHFDIKPHNILLSENFTPKISDFGLAKFYPTKGSITSLTAARGTIGYMAPELVYKNIGRVSYKADVYSFGMLLLEMAGKRRNLNALADNLSQIYYPFWVYDKLSNGNLVIENATEEENEICKKMILTGLWCIQMQPSERPQMNKVIEMLEGDLQNLKLPPRPALYPGESMGENQGGSGSMSVDFEESSSLIQNPR